MQTIGFISNIENNILYLTYTHLDYNIPFKSRDVRHFNIKDIVGIELKECISNSGIAYCEITNVCNFSQIEDLSQIQIFYEYQKYLIVIAQNKFDSNNFYNKLNELGISTILYIHLSDILKSNLDFINDYVSKISIEELISSRKVDLIESEYDKNGDCSYRCYIECTNYQDSYLNKLLRLTGSYSPTCVNNKPVVLPHETYQQAVNRIIKESKNNALAQYSKIGHIQQLLNECKIIKSLYDSEKQSILSQAKKYYDY